MTSLILGTATRLLVPLMLVFSLYLLWRGHNEPGGGFVGGLIAAIGFALYALGRGTAALREALRVDPRSIAMVGLAMAVAAGLLAALTGDAFLTGLWWRPTIGDGYLPLGTPLLFDVGVYLVVVGGVLTLLLALEEDDGRHDQPPADGPVDGPVDGEDG